MAALKVTAMLIMVVGVLWAGLKIFLAWKEWWKK